MKEKLQKDLGFIKSWVVRLIISLVLGAITTPPKFYSKSFSYTFWHFDEPKYYAPFLLFSVLYFACLYFFNTWLYHTSAPNNMSNHNKH